MSMQKTRSGRDDQSMESDDRECDGPAANLAKMDESMEEEVAGKGKMRDKLRKDAAGKPQRDTRSRKVQSPEKQSARRSKFRRFVKEWRADKENREAVDKQIEAVTEGDQVDYEVLLKDV